MDKRILIGCQARESGPMTVTDPGTLLRFLSVIVIVQVPSQRACP
jgi:hypothetical protein